MFNWIRERGRGLVGSAAILAVTAGIVACTDEVVTVLAPDVHRADARAIGGSDSGAGVGEAADAGVIDVGAGAQDEQSSAN